jgi:hypothetical protein
MFTLLIAFPFSFPENFEAPSVNLNRDGTRPLEEFAECRHQIDNKSGAASVGIVNVFGVRDTVGMSPHTRPLLGIRA